MRHLLFPLGKFDVTVQSHFPLCTAKLNWKCKHVFPKQVSMRKYTVRSLLEVKISPESVRTLVFVVPTKLDVIRLEPWLDFRQQDNWLDIIVQERKVQFKNLFDELYDSQVINVGNLLISNKLHKFKQIRHIEYRDLLLYSHFSKHETKDLIIDVMATTKVDEKINYKKIYTFTSQTWGNIIKLSAHHP